MAKIYTKGTWVDEVLSDTERYNIRDSEGNLVQANAEIALATSVVTPGTAVNAARMNNIENGLDAIDTLVNGHATPVKATGSEVITGTDDAKFATAKALRDAGILPFEIIDGVLYHKLLLTPGGLKPTMTNGCAPVDQIEMGTNKNVYDYLAFDKDAVEYAYINFEWPYEYAGNTILAAFNWTHNPAATTNFGVSLGLRGVCIDDAESLDVAFGTAQYVNDAGSNSATYKRYRTSRTSAITLAGTPQKGKMCQLQVLRNAIDVTNDTLAVDALLLSALVYYPVV